MKNLIKRILGWGVIGFVIGLLMAPDKGEKTRNKVASWIDRGKAKIDEMKKGGCCEGEDKDGCCK